MRRIIPRWSQLNRIGQSRTLRSSYIWLFAVPLLAKLLSRFNNDIVIPFWETPLRFHLSLPFSWKVFYFSAFAFALASFIYSVSCPSIVSNYSRLQEWTDEGRGGRQIVREFLFLLFRQSVNAHEQEMRLRHFADTLQTTVPTISYPESTTHHVDVERAFEIEVPPNKLGDAFWYVRDYADTRYPILRALCSSFYLIGFAFLAVVIMQNFIFVLRFSFSQ